MSLKLAARFVALAPNKIADLQENDTVSHILDLSPFVPPATLAVLLVADRASGTGSFRVYPKSDASANWTSSLGVPTLFTIVDQELKWKNSVANDDWDIYLLGYFVQKRTR